MTRFVEILGIQKRKIEENIRVQMKRWREAGSSDADNCLGLREVRDEGTD